MRFESVNLQRKALRAFLWLVFLIPLPGWGAALPEWLNDPYFYPGAEGTAPGYYGQWHLDNRMPVEEGVNAGLDVRIAGAWARGLTGQGVIIGIIDDGLEGSHPDLVANYRNEYSWDFTRTAGAQLNDPFRSSPGPGSEDFHGTSVAGVAAARGGNGIGLTGAAPLAGVAGLRFVSGSAATRTNHAAAILYQGGDDPFAPNPNWSDPDWIAPVRIKNHSYAYTAGFDPREQEVVDALQTSSDHGVIHVFSAANNRLNPESEVASYSPTQDTNKSPLLTLPHVLVVAALGSDGRYAAYSSYGASVFVTAPSDSRKGAYAIATTDLVGHDEGGNYLPHLAADEHFSSDYSYSSLFGGTSSAAPLVAGIMALGMEANPDLNLRMAQHLLARTSRIVDPNDASEAGGWVTNGGGFHFNENYGFGLIDADAFTLLATKVESLSERVIYDGGLITVERSFGNEEKTLSETFVMALGDPQVREAMPLEYVTVSLSISGLQSDWNAYMGEGAGLGVGAIVGDLEAWLTSPDGTRSRLLSNDRNLPGNRTDDLAALEWTLLSYAFWGEGLEGEWTLELSNASINDLALLGGTWDAYRFEFGTGTITFIPEPSALALFLFALVAGGGWRVIHRKIGP